MVWSALFNMTGPGDGLYSAVALKELIVAIDSLDEASKMRHYVGQWMKKYRSTYMMFTESD